MQVTELEINGEKYLVRKLTGFLLLNAISLQGKIGEMYRDLILAAVIDDKGKPVFTRKEIERMDTKQFSTLGAAVLELHSEDLENFQD